MSEKTDNILNLVRRTKFFADGFDKIENISSNKYKLKLGDKVYVLGFYPYHEYVDIKKEDHINEILSKIGLEPLRLYESGIMPDINKSYKIFDFRDERALGDFLSTVGAEDQVNLGKKFGSLLKKFHSIDLEGIKKYNWHKKELDRANYLFYLHGLEKEPSNKDYILLDYIKSNINLTRHTSENLLYKNMNLKNIRIYGDEKIDLRGLKELECGDGISDFVAINKISLKFPDFCKGVYKGYFPDQKPNRKFFKLLSFYQAMDLLATLVKVRQNKEDKKSLEYVEKILREYDDFSNIKPNWAIEN